jgi:hypothetical protein
MKAILLCCLVVVLLPAALPAGADPSVRLSWGSCDPVVANQDFAGPDTYRAVISGTGIAGTYIGFELQLIVLPSDGGPLPDAWRFDAAGCHTPTELDANYYGISKACPRFPGGSFWTGLGAYIDHPGTPPNSLWIYLSLLESAVVTDPATRYALVEVLFDRSRSVVGPGTPGETCGGAEVPVCLYLAEAHLYPPDPPDVPMTLENAGITWQGAHYGDGICSAAIPVQPSTWGRLKALFR